MSRRRRSYMRAQTYEMFRPPVIAAFRGEQTIKIVVYAEQAASDNTERTKAAIWLSEHEAMAFAAWLDTQAAALAEKKIKAAARAARKREARK